MDPKDWICTHCDANHHSDSTCSDIETLENEINNLNENTTFNLTNIDFTKHNDMIFNPLRFDHEQNDKAYNDVVKDKNVHNCNYLTSDQFNSFSSTKRADTNFLNINIRSISKNFDSLKETIKSINCKFDIIGISETHLKDNPKDLFNIDGYSMEYTIRTYKGKGGCLHVHIG